MEWFEVTLDLGDREVVVRRAPTEEALKKYITDFGEEPGCYPWGDIHKVSTDSKNFFVKEEDEQ